MYIEMSTVEQFELKMREYRMVEKWKAGFERKLEEIGITNPDDFEKIPSLQEAITMCDRTMKSLYNELNILFEGGKLY